MKFYKTIIPLCLSLGMLSVSCRDIDNEKDLEHEEDGVREINTTELEPVNQRETSDTTDYLDSRTMNQDSIYRESDVHLEHYQQMQEMEEEENLNDPN